MTSNFGMFLILSYPFTKDFDSSWSRNMCAFSRSHGSHGYEQTLPN